MTMGGTDAPAGGDPAERPDGGDHVGATAPSLAERLDLPPSANPEEAAAILAAVGAHLRDAEAAAAAATAESDDDDWTGERWRFAGRLAGLDGRGTRVPTGAPRDEWAASGRRDRF